jgi:heptaprenyl diphosphate synthase
MSIPKQLRKIADRELIKDLEKGLEEVETLIKDSIANTDKLLDTTSNHLVEAGGKRMRPVLTLLCSHLGDSTKKEVIQAATVIELTHLGTLYHDDVMDEADLRRGVPTAHSIWGNSVAILTGDVLFARASQVVSGLGQKALLMQAQTFERLVLGQLHETVGHEEKDELEFYTQVLKDKTGSLIALAAQLGSLLSEADEDYLDPLGEFGEAVGVAFQLMDDVIDIQSDDDDSGKFPGTDLRAGVPTLPVILLRKKTDKDSIELLELIDSGLESDSDLQKAVSLLRNHQVMEESMTAAVSWADKAKQSLKPLPDGSVKKALEAFADAVVERKG